VYSGKKNGGEEEVGEEWSGLKWSWRSLRKLLAKHREECEKESEGHAEELEGGKNRKKEK